MSLDKIMDKMSSLDETAIGVGNTRLLLGPLVLFRTRPDGED